MKMKWFGKKVRISFKLHGKIYSACLVDSPDLARRIIFELEDLFSHCDSTKDVLQVRHMVKRKKLPYWRKKYGLS